jgi:hypothetical protein
MDPSSRGFGYALLEGQGELVDWGLKGPSRRREPRNRWCLRQLASLIALHRPDVLILEEVADKESHRGPRARSLIGEMAALADERGVKVRRVSRRRVVRAFAPEDSTKYEIALAVATRFPELAWRLPPARKPWMSEDVRMRVFGAVALAFAHAARDRLRSEPSLAALRDGSSRR